MSFFVYVIFVFLFRITWFFCNVLFCSIRNTDMFYTLLINTLFLLASLLVCLLSLRLSINVKYLCLFCHSLLILTDILKFWPPPPPLPDLFWLPPFMSHLRVLLICDSYTSWSTRIVSLKLCVGFSIFDSVSFLLKFIFFLFNKMLGLLTLKRHNSFKN